MIQQKEKNFVCPYCSQAVSMLIDPSVKEQEMIEECTVCSSPIQVHYYMDQGILVDFKAEQIGQ